MEDRKGAARARRLRRAQRPGWGFAVGTALLLPPTRALAQRVWVDVDRIPETGGCIVVLNHVSHIDPLVTGDVLWSRGRLPRYLAKSNLFTIPFVGHVLRSAGQIPVVRMTSRALDAYGAAVEAVNAGELLAVYPEGTLTRDPELWPMRGKTGAARIALATGAPVIPMGHWGAHEVLVPYTKVPRFWRRGRVTVKVGAPVDLSDLLELEVTPAVIQEAVDRIMAAIVEIVEELRGESAPPVRFDPVRAGVKVIGNPGRRILRKRGNT